MKNILQNWDARLKGSTECPIQLIKITLKWGYITVKFQNSEAKERFYKFWEREDKGEMASNDIQSRILYSTQLSIKCENGIQSFSDIHDLKKQKICLP